MLEDDLLLKNYDFELPLELIAQRPIDSDRRDLSKLLVYNQNNDALNHDHFANIINHLPKNCLLVFNQTKVFPARLFGNKVSGGEVEVFILELSHDLFNGQENLYTVFLKSSGKKIKGMKILLPDFIEAEIFSLNDDGTFVIRTNKTLTETYLEKFGIIPIPPYIRKGEADEADRASYQTKYAKHSGSVAAPTAGLHFTNDLLDRLQQNGIELAYVTLHVGIGTFKPIKVDNILEHQMHSEKFFIDEENLDKIKSAKNIVAVGTTTLRVLESIVDKEITPNQVYSTNIFLYPTKKIKSIVGLVTNFHLPESSLLILVAAIIGRNKVLDLYNEAIKLKYRFFSYGDAMLILRKQTINE